MSNLHGKKLAYHYLNKVTNSDHLSIDDSMKLIVEIVRLDDRVKLYEWCYNNQLIENNNLQQENEFLTRELEKYES